MDLAVSRMGQTRTSAMFATRPLQPGSGYDGVAS